MRLSGTILIRAFLFIFLAELLSVFGYLLPVFNQITFFVIVAVTLILSLRRLEYGILIVLAELFIGSKGYLFYFTAGDTVISIRIALWLIVMSVWLAGIVIRLAKTKKLKPEFPVRRTLLPYFAVLSAFIAWGLIRGMIGHNGYADIFFDFNGWLYLALALPVYGIVFSDAGAGGDAALPRLRQVFTAAMAWLALKTFFLLFVFSHGMLAAAPDIYRWVRTSGVGEITDMQNGFYRIFFQSHIFALAAFFIFLFLLLGRLRPASSSGDRKKLFSDKRAIVFFLMLSAMLAVNLIGFARSNWAGLLAGVSAVLCYHLWLEKGARIRRAILALAVLAAALIAGAGIITAIVKFPFPGAAGGFNAAGLITERAGKITGEAGVASRWSLLPPLAEKIISAPVLGSGFGATVTYRTSDPRALESSADGNYTTYAFEWGWLDIWLKLGIFGLLSYIILLLAIFRTGITAARLLRGRARGDEEDHGAKIIIGMLAGLFAIMAVNLASPYLNHPLGIGYVILCAAVIDRAGLSVSGAENRALA